MRDFKTTKEEILNLSGGKRERAEALLEKAEFMNAELQKLQKIVAEKGWTEAYQNGANQHGLKKCTEGEVYNAMIKNYAAVMRQLDDMLEDIPDQPDAQDEFFK